MQCLPFFTFFSSFLLVSLIKLSFAADSITQGQSITDGRTLVSSFKSFELGFFSPVNSNNWYVGIWYKNSPNTVVWVANRDRPITDNNGILTVSNNGSLLLLNGEKSVIWSSSNSSRVSANPVAQLLDSGNLVLRESINTSAENYMWQSFDYPSDTLLPGMKLGWNLKTGFERYLTPWKSAEDPYPGDFILRLDINRLPELVILTGSTKETRSGPWNGQQFGGIPRMHNSIFIPMLVEKEDELYFTYKPFNDRVITRLLVNQSGTLQRLVWNETSAEWNMLYSWPFDLCDSYAKCGANGNCRISESPTCDCLRGYISKSQDEWDSPQSRKCVKKPSDCPSGEGFLKLPQMKLPKIDWSNKSMNLKECEAECIKNCSCRAYANSNLTGRGSGCLMWFGDLIDIRECSERYIWGQDIFIRVPASELESVDPSNMKQRLTIIVVVSIISVVFILGLLFCIAWKKTRNSGLESWKEEIEVPLYDIATIAAATNNFSEAKVIGKGGFGPVYKGTLSTGQEVAVKRLSNDSGQGLEEFMNEVVLIGKLQHRNLVQLIGSCIQANERILIYEYMPHKSLDCLIFDHKSRMLSWKKRFSIILGIARGLLYLHQDSNLQVIHRDLKASNILLDSDLNPKISDFGLARIFKGDDNEANTNRVAGTYGYMSPEYATDGIISLKSDVFSLGVLLLEIVSGKMNRGFRHPDHRHNLLGHAWLLWNYGRGLEVMDTCLTADTFIESQVLRCIQVGLLCVQKLPEDRPDMSLVVFMLANEGVALPQPRQPGFFTERGLTAAVISNKEKFYSENALSITLEEGR